MGAVVGVLALQGAFAAHELVLTDLGARTRQVRTPADLRRVDALVMPGGESGTMWQLLESSGLFDAVADRLAKGMPVFGTCAGMILLASNVLDGRAGQRSFAAIDITVRRNAYGRQNESFEADLRVKGLSSPFHAVFIRAPRLEAAGRSVKVLARHDEVPVLAQHGAVTVASFHPELTHDSRLHQMFLNQIRSA